MPFLVDTWALKEFLYPYFGVYVGAIMIFGPSGSGVNGSARSMYPKGGLMFGSYVRNRSYGVEYVGIRLEMIGLCSEVSESTPTSKLRTCEWLRLPRGIQHYLGF